MGPVLREGASPHKGIRKSGLTKQDGHGRRHAGFNERYDFSNPPETRNMRTVWTLGPEPFPDAHFAVMPSALVTPCIKAGTSERGGCATCGAPWARVIDRDRPGDRGKKVDTYEAEGGTMNRRTHPGSHHAARRESVGWEPTCDHGGEPVPCVVLDPFTGSGTVGMVSVLHGRSFVGAELNPKYIELARKRIGGAAPLLAVEATAPEEEPVAPGIAERIRGA